MRRRWSDVRDLVVQRAKWLHGRIVDQGGNGRGQRRPRPAHDEVDRFQAILLRVNGKIAIVDYGIYSLRRNEKKRVRINE